MRKSFHRSLGLVVLLLTLGWGFEARAQDTAAAPAQSGAQSLYKRLGGYDALAAVTDEFIGRLVTDKSLGRFFGGASEDSKKRIRQLVVDQLCAATGGPCLYIGRSMKTVHTGLGITEEDWNIAVKHLTDSLNKFKVPKPEQDEFFKIVATLKPDIVEKK
jgi:hemoglobin